MTGFRVLIIDAHREQRRRLRSLLAQLEPSLQVVDMPSGEEALLEYSRQKVDLVITGLRLPGMSGMELMERLRLRTPNQKVILITGKEASHPLELIRKAGAEAVLQKPVADEAFTAAVAACLGLEAPAAQTAARLEEPAPRPLTIGEQITNLRQKTKAAAVFLIGDSGKIMVQAGDYPPLQPGSPLMSDLLVASSAGGKITQALGLKTQALGYKAPQHLQVYAGGEAALLSAPVGRQYLLVLAAEPGAFQNWLQGIYPELQAAIQSLAQGLEQIGLEPLAQADLGGVAAAEALEEALDELEASDEQLEGLLSGVKAKKLAKEAEDYWDTVVKERPTGSLNADVLSYDEASRLGLAPEEGEE